MKETASIARLSIIALLLLAATGVVVFAQGRAKGNNEASGTLAVEDGEHKTEIRLKYVYATYNTYSKALGINPDWDLMFSDKPLPEDAIERKAYIDVLANEGKFNGLILDITSEGTIDDVKAYCNICKHPHGSEFLFNDEADKQVFEKAALDDKSVAGSAHSSLLIDASGINERWKFQYKVAFNAAINMDSATSRWLAESEDEPGRAYLSFYKAVEAEDLEAIKRLVAADYLKAFEGREARDRLLRIKTFIKPFRRVFISQLIAGNQSAGLFIEEDVPGVQPRPHISNTGLGATMSPPPVAPPAPPSPPPVIVKPRRGASPSAKRGARQRALPPAPPRYARLMHARLVLEDRQWKIFWLLDSGNNLLATTYNTAEERVKAAAEDERRANEAYFTVEGGSPLAAGGGDAGKAYLEFCRAERLGNKRALVKYLTGAQHDLFNSPGLTIRPGAFIWKESTALDYTNIEVVGGTSNQESAVLDVQAVRLGYRTTGKVRMLLEDGQWKIEREKWQTDTSKKVPVVKRP